MYMCVYIYIYIYIYLSSSVAYLSYALYRFHESGGSPTDAATSRSAEEIINNYVYIYIYIQYKHILLINIYIYIYIHLLHRRPLLHDRREPRGARRYGKFS